MAKNLIEDFIEAIKPEDKQTDNTYTAKVAKVDKDGTVWVYVAGSDMETPTASASSEVKRGDEVKVEWRNNKLYIAGNTTNPSAGVETVAKVEHKAVQAQNTAVKAQSTAESASRIAGNTNQYFWHTETGTDTGAHITEVPREEFLADPTNGGGNLLARSNGIAVRDGLTELATFGTEVVINTTDGTELAHFGYALGQSSSGSAIAPYYTFGNRRTETTIGGDPTTEAYDPTATYALGDLCIYNNRMRVCISPITTPEPWTSSHWRIAIGNKSIAEGRYTTAAGEASHAEGSYTAALDVGAHAEGILTRAGYAAHASGAGTVAMDLAQTAIGRYNDNQGTNVFEIGNGTDDNYRSNAFAVDWDGYIYPQNTKMTDFVVEQGTSGIWTYRKWNSGIAECWGTYTASIAVNTSSAAYGGYRSAQITAPNFPITFTSAPTITAVSANGGGHWVNNIASSTTNVKFYLSIGASAAAANRSVAFHVFGKWA